MFLYLSCFFRLFAYGSWAEDFQLAFRRIAVNVLELTVTF
jgi:hypothetical protein